MADKRRQVEIERNHAEQRTLDAERRGRLAMERISRLCAAPDLPHATALERIAREAETYLAGLNPQPSRLPGGARIPPSVLRELEAELEAGHMEEGG